MSISWTQAATRGLVSGSIASAAVNGAVTWVGLREAGSPWAASNATSHWLWQDEALGRDDASLDHTVLGAATTHAATLFWATLYEKWFVGDAPPRAPLAIARDAALLAGLAYVVDYTITPKRLTPGWEHRVGKRSMFTIYAAMAGGFALASWLRGRRSSGGAG